MARFLAYTTPAPGQVFPIVDMLLELRRRGHDVHLWTEAVQVERLRALGLDTVAVDPAIEAIQLDDWRARMQLDAMRRILRFYEARAELEIPDMRRAIDAVRPDALIVDNGAEGAGYVAERSRLPWAQYCPYPPPFASRDAPPHGTGWRPAGGPLGRARDRAWRAMGERLLAPHVALRNEMRAALELPPVERYEDQWRVADRFVAFTAEPYEYPRSDWPASVRLVGPGTWGPPADPPDWLAAETRPIVLVTTSTAYQADARLIATALEAFAGEDVALVATAAANDAEAFTPPPNARVEPFVPHGPVIARAACVVSHGGQGTTQKALAAGVPVCVVPFCRDQFDVARRVELAGAGVRLHHRRLRPDRLRAAVREAIAKRPGAERVARAFA
ncbi:MAG TPA: nucleotide disphospho-sugar-binding domain-containing protein, partial [Solirubrobacteraceae bacterium]|nr:nucleotide disphospho-sugar-binding domain-containing protein [Solirubrobacteraceae bacterium]